MKSIIQRLLRNEFGRVWSYYCVRVPKNVRLEFFTPQIGFRTFHCYQKLAIHTLIAQ